MPKIFDYCKRRPRNSLDKIENPLSILDAQGKDPQRLKPVVDGCVYLFNSVARISNVAIDSFSRINNSLVEVFCLNLIWNRLKKATLMSVAESLAPYGTVFLTEKFINEQLQMSETVNLWSKSTLGVLFLGYLMSERITEKTSQISTAQKVFYQACAIWSFMNLHIMTYQAGQKLGNDVFSSLEQEKYINAETKDNLSILTAILSTFCLLPHFVLLMAKVIESQKGRYEAGHGLKSQSSKVSNLQLGKIPEVSHALIIYDHFARQLKDPERLFQYFIVSLNVLRDVTVPDPLNPHQSPPKGLSLFLNKTRNVWLLAIDSLIKAKADFQYRSQEIKHDQLCNSQEYLVIRKGKTIPNVKRFELRVGDLVPLSQSVYSHKDPSTQEERLKATLSGYLVQLHDVSRLKKIALSLVELNGENHPVIVEPRSEVILEQDLDAIDLFSIPLSSALLPGVEILSYDNGNHDANAEGLYLQVACANVIKPSFNPKTPHSLVEIKDFKKRLIYGSLFFSATAALPLMNYHSIPFHMKKMIQYYGTEFIDKFSQIFSEAQTIIPLVSEVMLEMVNTTLVKEVNHGLSSSLSMSQALCVADLFEFIRQKKLKIFSDKTGTVTETFMQLRSISFDQTYEQLKRIVKAFATTFSDQKTEAEENEIKRFLKAHYQIDVRAKPTLGSYGSFEKTIFIEDTEVQTFETKRLGLFTDFGGVFSLREEKGQEPVCVFCGIPREDLFQKTSLLEAYRRYEKQEHDNENDRKDYLTRDWCIAETKLSLPECEQIKTALGNQDVHAARSQMAKILEPLVSKFQYLGVFQIDNPIKKGAREAILKWKAAAIDFLLVTGDTKNAARLIAKKLYGSASHKILEPSHIVKLSKWSIADLSDYTIVFSDTNVFSMTMWKLLSEHKTPPFMIFCQMKDVDKQKLVEEAKKEKKFILANGDGCNDLLMFNSAHIAFANSSLDGTFARGVEEASTMTDLQVRDLMKTPEATLFEMLDFEKGKQSVFLKHFSRLANTQPKIISSLMAKSLKNMAVPRVLGKFTREIPGQFGLLLGYDAAYLSAIHQAALSTASTPLLDRSIKKANFPLAVLISSIAIASLQSLVCYHYLDRQITSTPLLLSNLAIAVGSLFVFLAPPGYQTSDA